LIDRLVRELQREKKLEMITAREFRFEICVKPNRLIR